MPEERANQGGVVRDFLQLVTYSALQTFSRAHSRACDPRALCMAPHEFVRIQVGCVSWQSMQREPAGWVHRSQLNRWTRSR